VGICGFIAVWNETGEWCEGNNC